MAQGSPTIGFGQRGSLDYASGSGQGGGGPRKTTGRNLCFNPSFNTGCDGYQKASTLPTLYLASINLQAVKPLGVTNFDSALLGTTCGLVGGVAYNQDHTWTFDAVGLDTNAWIAVSSCTVARVTTPVHSGAGALQVTSTSGNATAGLRTDLSYSLIKVWENRQYTASAWVRTAATSRNAQLLIVYYNAAGSQIGSTTGVAVADSTTYQQISVNSTAPTGAYSAAIWVQWLSAANTEVHYVDDVRFFDVAGAAAVATGAGGDSSEELYAVYYFHALPNTTYTISGYTRIAPDFCANVGTDVNYFNNYVLRVRDPNDSVNFPDPTVTVGTVLTGSEYRQWVRHAVTYTTGSVVTQPLEIRLYGNKIPETGFNYGGTGLTEQQYYPWTWGSSLAQNSSNGGIMALSSFNIGSYWDGIQIEESTAPSSYIDGTQRNCDWSKSSNDLCTIANYIPDGTTFNWTVNSSGGTAPTVTAVALSASTDGDRWFSVPDYALSAGSIGPQPFSPLTGYNCVQFTGVASARTRSALVFDYHGNGYGATGPATQLVSGKRGMISFYARGTPGGSGNPNYVVSLEDAAGTNVVVSASFSLTTQWRRFILRWDSAAGNIDTTNTRLVFRQADPTQIASMQVAGVQFDSTVTGSANDLAGINSDYLCSFPAEQENDRVLPGSAQKNEFAYFNSVAHRSVRYAAAEDDGVTVGLPSFTGRVENATIDLSVISRSYLFGIYGREWREIRFANDAESSRNGFEPNGNQLITLWGDPFIAGNNYGIGIQAGTLYQRTGVGSNFRWFVGGRHDDRAGNAGGGLQAMWLDSAGRLSLAQATGALQQVPFIQGGTASCTFSGSATSGITSVTFPVAFNAAPVVVCQIVSSSGSMIGATALVTATSTTGFNVELHATAAITGSFNVEWLAANSQ